MGHLLKLSQSLLLNAEILVCSALHFIRLVGKLAPISSKATKIIENFSVARKCHWRPENSVIEDQLISLTNCLEAGDFRSPAY